MDLAWFLAKEHVKFGIIMEVGIGYNSKKEIRMLDYLKKFHI